MQDETMVGTMPVEREVWLALSHDTLVADLNKMAEQRQSDVEMSIAYRIGALEAITKDVYEAFDNDTTAGQSSFRDIAGNLLAGAISDQKFLDGFDPEDADPDDMADAEYSRQELPRTVDLLEEYMGVLASDRKVFDAELSGREGAYPDIRRLADEESARGAISSPVRYYVESIVELHQAEDTIAQQPGA